MSRIKRASQIDAITEYLFVEGYADTVESAEVIAESISSEWSYEILDEIRHLAHRFGSRTPEELESIRRIALMNKGIYPDSPEPESPEPEVGRQRSARRRRINFIDRSNSEPGRSRR